MNRRAMSLVELMVVIGIILVLSALLLPTLSAVRESANRLMCANALRQWGVTMLAYAQDNRGMIPRTPGYDWPAAANWSMSANDVGPHPNQFAVARVIEYIPGATYNSATMMWDWKPGLYSCASNRDMAKTKAWNGAGSAWTTYAYFGWSGSWIQNNPGNPKASNSAVSQRGRDQLMNRRIEGSRLLMMDLVVDHGPNRGGFHANHLRGRKNYGPFDQLAGANQLWGDGRVAWKNGVDFGFDGMRLRTGDNFASTVPPGWQDVYWF